MIPQRGGLPHSDIHGSTPARGSPWLFAACHVLHRLLVPRHPPNALLMLLIHSPAKPSFHSARPSIPPCTGTIPTKRQAPGSRFHTEPTTLDLAPSQDARTRQAFSPLSFYSTSLNTAVRRHSPRPLPSLRMTTAMHGSDTQRRQTTDDPTRPLGEPRHATCAHGPPRNQPSRPAHPGMHQNLIHNAKDLRQAQASGTRHQGSPRRPAPHQRRHTPRTAKSRPRNLVHPRPPSPKHRPRHNPWHTISRHLITGA